MSTHNIPFFNIKRKITLNYPKSAVMGFFSWGLKHEFKTAMVSETSVFEPLGSTVLGTYMHPYDCKAASHNCVTMTCMSQLTDFGVCYCF